MLVLERLAAEAVRSHVEEANAGIVCGVLVGRGGLDQRIAVRAETARIREGDTKDEGLQLHPLDFQRIDQEARKAGLDVVGVYRSRPPASGEPSAKEPLCAWEGYSYLMVRTSEGRVEGMTSFERVEGELEPEALQVRA